MNDEPTRVPDSHAINITDAPCGVLMDEFYRQIALEGEGQKLCRKTSETIVTLGENAIFTCRDHIKEGQQFLLEQQQIVDRTMWNENTGDTQMGKWSTALHPETTLEVRGHTDTEK